MRKLLVFLFIFNYFLINSCSSKDTSDNDEFIYDLNTLYGIWKVTEIDTGSGYEPVHDLMIQTYTTFNSDGTYSTKGYYGSGSGKYLTVNKSIKCYIEDKLFMTFEVLNLSENNAEFKMSKYNGTAKIKYQKQ